MKESVIGAGIPTRSQIDESCYYRWVEPNSDVTVCLRLDTMDRLQMEVLKGAGPLARNAGTEVGGILLGRIERDQGRILTFVDDFEAAPCEHRGGPSYVLTAKDAINFESVLARHKASPAHSVVGYYRSHNRGGLFLSPDDVRLINRYFREPDNLFLLIKTLPSRACTAGFFFWKDGHLQSEFTDSEAPLIPISFPAGEATGKLLVGAPGPFPPGLEKQDAIVSAAVEAGRNPHYGLMRGIALAAMAAAVTIAVIRYRTPQPVHPTEGLGAPQVIAENRPPVPPAMPAPASIRKRPPAGISNPKTILPPTTRQIISPRQREPQRPVPATIPEVAAAVPPIATESSTTTAPPKIPVVSAEAPVSPAEVRTETRVAPPAPATPPPLPENPAPASTGAPAANAGMSVPSNPPVSAPAHTHIGPRVIHQVPPAVPRSVRPMLTTDVLLEVEVAIDATGKVASARIASTKGAAAGLLTIEALKAAQLFRFQPAQENGHNIASVTVLTFRFDRITK